MIETITTLAALAGMTAVLISSIGLAIRANTKGKSGWFVTQALTSSVALQAGGHVLLALLSASTLLVQLGEAPNQTSPPEQLPPSGSPAPNEAAAEEEFRRLPVVYRRPKTMKYDEANLFELVIASRDLDSARRRIASLSGPEHIAQVQIGSKVRAHLWSPTQDVVIKERDSPTKAVKDLANVSWVWSVVPKTDGDVILMLSLYNIPDVGDETDGPTYQDTFVVTKPWHRKVIDWVATWNPVWVAFVGAATVIATVAAWLWRPRGGKGPPFKFKRPDK